MSSDLTLERHPRFAGREGPLLIVIMDGVGIGHGDASDAVAVARTPTLDALRDSGRWLPIAAHGTAVGMLSDGDMGNSEVGHNCIGAGRVFAQGAKLVQGAIESGRIWEGEAWKRIVSHCVRERKPLHLIGLLSDGNVHSHIDHVEALVRKAAAEGIPELYLHVLLDGRDVPATSALDYLERVEKLLGELDGGDGRRYRIASGGGRQNVTMDRYEANWRIVETGWKAHVRGEARAFASAREAVETFRAESPGVIDQDLPAFVVAEGGEAVGPIRDGAAVVTFNFRGDRMIEIARAFEDESFSHFDRSPRPDVLFAGMMQYDGDLGLPEQFLVEPPAIDRTMTEFLVHSGVTQFASSETQKFGHVTYFWNGNRSGMLDSRLETYVEVPSDRVPFEQRPWMKSAEIADLTAHEIRSRRHRFLRINFANGDMVGHTGHFDATVISVEALDLALARLLAAVRKAGGAALITADHGNADDMWERAKDGTPKVGADTKLPLAKTSHSLNPVPFFIYDPHYAGEYEIDGDLERPGLGNVAATCLAMMGFRPPEDYAPSLIRVRE